MSARTPQEADGSLRRDRDVTDQKRAEQERALDPHLRQAQRLEAIGTLANGIAHELNNPLNGIMNYAQLIVDECDSESSAHQFAREIIKEVERVAGIVQNLLQFARSDEQSFSSPARLPEMVDSILVLIRTLLRHDQIQLFVDVPRDLPEVRCHSQQIQQVLLNLLINARDALNERYPGQDENKVIRVTGSVMEGQGPKWVRVSIEDYGPGIPAEIRDRVFDPFFTTHPRARGAGLGLAISDSIVREHGGRLTLESEVGRFTRFHVDLPVTPD